MYACFCRELKADKCIDKFRENHYYWRIRYACTKALHRVKRSQVTKIICNVVSLFNGEQSIMEEGFRNEVL